MFTYNFIYTSAKEIRSGLASLELKCESEVFVRIHTAIHDAEQSVRVACLVKEVIPEAKIFGTSTSSVIDKGSILADKCLISVTVLEHGKVSVMMKHTFEKYDSVKPEVLAKDLSNNTDKGTKMILAFFTSLYSDVYRFVEECNKCMPGIPMAGGIANTSEVSLIDFAKPSFVFNENGWMKDGAIFAVFSGEKIDAMVSYASGAETIGDETEITKAYGPCIIEINHDCAANYYKTCIGDILDEHPEFTNIFPYVYSDNTDIPFIVYYRHRGTLADFFSPDIPYNNKYISEHPDVDINETRDYLVANHDIVEGKKIKRAFIYDKKIIADNNKLYHSINDFEKAETLFGYSCIARSIIYSNCAKWELSPYADTGLSGCITAGEITCNNGRNTFANCSFTVAVIGEKRSTQALNEFALSNTEKLVEDNKLLLSYLTNIEKYFSGRKNMEASGLLADIRMNYETKLLYGKSGKIGNLSHLYFDINLDRTDKVCAISVPNAKIMETFMQKSETDRIFRNFNDKCLEYSEKNSLEIYEGRNKWEIIIGAGEKTSLSDFEMMMHELNEEMISADDVDNALAIRFVILVHFGVSDLQAIYNSAVLEMEKKKLQFLVYKDETVTEKNFREQYDMTKIIKDAIVDDRVVPYYQGIRNNETGQIDYFEALMRIRGSDGKIYTPNQFLGVAQDYGVLYDRISYSMIQKSLERFKDEENKKISINLSIRDIKNRDVVSYIFKFLSNVAHPENFVFELLESEDIDDYEYVYQFTTRIHMLGAKLALDDFGSGYANLMHIIKIEFDIIKIDGEIIRQCTTNKKSQDLIRLLSLWKRSSRNDISIVAEYVENKEIQKLINVSKIDYSQGYYFAKPEENPKGLSIGAK